MNRLTTLGFILCSLTVHMKVTHLVWFSTWVSRRFRELCPGIICCSRRQCEKADSSPQSVFNKVMLHRCGVISLKTLSEGLPDEVRHSGDNTILSTAIPPYLEFLIAAIITICNDNNENWQLYYRKNNFIQTQKKL